MLGQSKLSTSSLTNMRRKRLRPRCATTWPSNNVEENGRRFRQAQFVTNNP
jgi:hypothetical protein